MRERESSGNRVGDWIRHQRRRRGLSQEVLAHQIDRSRRWLIDVECGRTEPSLSKVVELSRALNADPRELLAASQKCVSDAADRRKLSQQEEQGTKRSDFVRLAAFTVSGTLGFGGIDWQRAASSGVRRSVDDRTLDDLEMITASYARQRDVLAPCALLPVVHAHLSMLVDLLPGSTGSRALSLASDTAVVALLLALQIEDRGSAGGYWALARELSSKIGGETHARALIAVSHLHSRIMYDAEGSPIAIDLLNAAESAAGTQASRLLRTWVLARRAEEHAALGNADASDHDLAAAGACLSEPEACSDPIVGPADSCQLNGYRGTCAALLGRHQEAEIALRATLDSMPTSLVGWRSIVHADLAAALVGQREVEEACSVLDAALTLALEVGATHFVERVLGVRRRLDPWTDVPVVKRLDERLALAV